MTTSSNDGRAQPTRVSVRSELRTATAALHAAVDAGFSSILAEGQTGYRTFLARSAAAVFPLEKALAAAGVETLLPDWPQRSRMAALASDLRDLGEVEPPDATGGLGPAMTSEAFQFGVLYVLEGSRLGARMLARRVAAARPGTATRYLRHGDGQPLWPTFLERLEASRAARDGLPETRAGAHMAFELFRRAAIAPAEQEV